MLTILSSLLLCDVQDTINRSGILNALSYWSSQRAVNSLGLVTVNSIKLGYRVCQYVFYITLKEKDDLAPQGVTAL